MKELVATMVRGKLGAKSIGNYTQIVKMVVGSAVDEQGEQLHPRKWNSHFIDAPVVNKKTQKKPHFTSEVLSGIVRVTNDRMHKMLFILCGAAGLRVGEALGIDIADISPDRRTIKIRQKAWRGEIHKRLKTPTGDREIDLCSKVAVLLDEYIGKRKSGLLFCSRTGRQLWQTNVLRRHLHPALQELGWKDEQLGLTKSGTHAFRRFRETHLRNFTATPPGLYQFWMGHAGTEMSDIYDMIRFNVEFRKTKAEEAGIGFELPSTIAVIGRNGRKRTETPSIHLAATA
jgi:integrase